MHCWNCGHTVPAKARVCGHCEANLAEAPSPEEAAAVIELLEQIPPEALAEMAEAMKETETALEFANLIMVGPCPNCGSKQTGDCEADPEIDDLLVGRCYECGRLWCTECRKELTREKLYCECWDETE